MKSGTLLSRRLCVLAAASVTFLAAPGAVAQSSAEPASLQWSVPTSLPPSARVAVVRGDPTAAGHSATVPAGMPHFWIAGSRTVVSLTFIGPFTITYLRSEDAPPRRLFPFGY